MEIHPVYGPCLPEKGWVPAPRYLLRRQLILEQLKKNTNSDLLEIGPGPAALLYELAISGWNCCALEQSDTAISIARGLHKNNGLAAIYDRPQNSWENHFGWLLSFEVLEHIKDDRSALKQWRAWLRPGGRILLSVPAHDRKWGPTDVWAGHFRRYEKDGLVKLVSECGFEVESIFSYGFPLSNIIEPIRGWHHNRLLKKSNQVQNSDQDKRNGTDRSGTTRSLETRLFPLYSNMLGVTFMKLAFWLQKKFLDKDLGTGYLIQAKRKD
jgi:SAM-dependent methyltransferase